MFLPLIWIKNHLVCYYFCIFCSGNTKDAPLRHHDTELARCRLDWTFSMRASISIKFHNKRGSIKKKKQTKSVTDMLCKLTRCNCLHMAWEALNPNASLHHPLLNVDLWNMKSTYFWIWFSNPNGSWRYSYLTFVYNTRRSSVVENLNSSLYKGLFSVTCKFCQAKYLGWKFPCSVSASGWLLLIFYVSTKRI